MSHVTTNTLVVRAAKFVAECSNGSRYSVGLLLAYRRLGSLIARNSPLTPRTRKRLPTRMFDSSMPSEH
jgi:hypothetical protein